MSGSHHEHQALRRYMRTMWVPYVRDYYERKALGETDHTTEHTLMLYGGQPPDKGYPKDWPEETLIIEHEVVRLIPPQKKVICVELGVIRKPVVVTVAQDGTPDIEYRKLSKKEKQDAVHMGHTKYYQTLYGAMSALWQPVRLRRLVEAA